MANPRVRRRQPPHPAADSVDADDPNLIEIDQGYYEQGKNKSARRSQENNYLPRALKATARGTAKAAKGMGVALRNSYGASNVGKEYHRLGGTIFDTLLGLPARVARNALNTAGYVVKTVAGAPESIAKLLHKKVAGGLEEDLEDKLANANAHHMPTITLSEDELQAMHRYGADTAIQHLSGRVKQAEEEQHSVRIPLSDARRVLTYIHRTKKTDILEHYRGAVAVLAFVFSVLFFDQVKITGFAVSGINGNYDYFSLFGFLFLALGLILLLMGHYRKRK